MNKQNNTFRYLNWLNVANIRKTNQENIIYSQGADNVVLNCNPLGKSPGTFFKVLLPCLERQSCKGECFARSSERAAEDMDLKQRNFISIVPTMVTPSCFFPHQSSLTYIFKKSQFLVQVVQGRIAYITKYINSYMIQRPSHRVNEVFYGYSAMEGVCREYIT